MQIINIFGICFILFFVLFLGYIVYNDGKKSFKQNLEYKANTLQYQLIDAKAHFDSLRAEKDTTRKELEAAERNIHQLRSNLEHIAWVLETSNPYLELERIDEEVCATLKRELLDPLKFNKYLECLDKDSEATEFIQRLRDVAQAELKLREVLFSWNRISSEINCGTLRKQIRDLGQQKWQTLL